MNDQKQIMNIFAQAYQLLAKASKQQPSKEGFQQILELLGEDGIQECAKVADQGPEAVAQAMVQIIQQKQTQKAANGAKLRYIMQLQGKCQPGYLKKGGRCKPCEKKTRVFNNKADLSNNGGNFANQKKYFEKKQDGGNVPQDREWFSKKGYNEYHPNNESQLTNNFNFQQHLYGLRPQGITPKGNAYFKVNNNQLGSMMRKDYDK